MLYNYTTFHKKKSLYHYKNTSIPLIRKMQTSLNCLLFRSPCTGGIGLYPQPSAIHIATLSRPSDDYADTHLALTFDKFCCTRHRQNLKTAFFILLSALVCLTLTGSKLGGGSEKCKQVCFFAHLALTL